MKVLQPSQAFVVTASDETYLLADNIQSIGLQGLCQLLLRLRSGESSQKISTTRQRP